MKVIKRQMITEGTTSTAEHNINEFLPCCQASFNSDGNITLRNYDRSDKNKDEIIILSESETTAVIGLLREIARKITKFELPF